MVLLHIHCNILPKVQYNESGHPPFKFSFARCPRLTALASLTSEWQSVLWQCSWVHHLAERQNPMGQCKHQVCRAGCGGQPGPWSVLIWPSASYLWRVWWVSCSELLKDRTLCDTSKSPLRHLMLVCSYPYCSCMSMPHPHVCCLSWVVDAGYVAHECTMHADVSSSSPDRVLSCDGRRTQHSVHSCDNQQHGYKVAWLLQPRYEEPSSLHVLREKSS